MHLKRNLRWGALAVALALVMGIAPGAATAAPSSAPAAQPGTVHVVQLGESLYGIAARYGVSADAIAAANGIFNWNYIYAGQALTIPGAYRPPAPGHGGPPPSSARYHTVRLGETLYGIAWQYGTTVSAILSLNNLANPDYIFAGQQLALPGGYSPPSGPPPGHGSPPPTCGGYYIVKPGNTLSGIAAWHGTTIYTLAAANHLRYPDIIYPGQSLHIPCGSHQPGHGQKPPQGRPRPKPTAAPTLHPAACARQVQISDPLEGEHVSGTLQIVGTANIPNFQFYKVEYAMGHVPLDSAFASIGNVVGDPVVDGVLRTWSTNNMPAGAYTLRLTAVDTSGNFPQPCRVRIHIDH